MLTGAVGVSETALAWAVSQGTKTQAVIIAEDDSEARRIYSDMLNFDKKAVYLPFRDTGVYYAATSGRNITAERIEALFKIGSGQAKTVVMPAEALLHRVSPKDVFLNSFITLKPGDIFPPEDLVKKLTEAGYEHADKAEGQGQFALRGGIMDIFPMLWESPVRIEFWDDEIDSVRLLDRETMRSLENLDEAIIYPAKEFIADEKTKEKAYKKINSEYEKMLKKFEESGKFEATDNLKAEWGMETERFRDKGVFEKDILYGDLFFGEKGTVFDYFDKNAVLYFVEISRIRDILEHAENSFCESIIDRAEAGYMLPSRTKALISAKDIFKNSEDFRIAVFSLIRGSVPEFDIKEQINFMTKNTASFRNRTDLFGKEISYLKDNGYTVLIFTKSKTLGERLSEELDRMGVESVLSMRERPKTVSGRIYISSGGFSGGFVMDDIKLALFTDTDVLGRAETKRKRRLKKKKASAIERFTELKPGDFVVHEVYGIGEFRGLENISVDGISKDYLKIQYAAGGSLFIPVSQMDMVQKYIGSEGAKPKLSKLGGGDWERAKSKARKTVSILAEDLVELYAKRQAAQGYTYSKDTVWQKEFEETFPYEETEDQLNAIEDVKRDMESPKIMDRLICGDVGYGKTEVALRAAFKAVQDSRQVAFLVPTTILAEQHYNTFKERMNGYPVNIEVLSRFRPAAENKNTIRDLKDGVCDIVIGTHRLLSKDVSFKDLGLIIIDEEQKFGVAHKEKLKRLRENVDVLALSATPIPRTLHMSLSGIRDMSVLDEPPMERQIVQTYVMEYEPFVVKEAVMREVSRGGQVFYLHNRVMDMERTVSQLRELLPHVKIAFANGQMPEKVIEDTMKSFIEGETDVLVCTTIIENGVDMPNVNTIIIEDSDRLGLSQLYQLRGRVGRSSTLAYAYMLYRKDKIITEEAEKRLKTIKEFTEFGAGFKIAMKDLEIRGAGSLLGAEQHGSMNVVGYDMYCRLLQEEIERLKGAEPKKQEFETVVDLNINAFIPSYYIRNQETRLNVYKRIAGITNSEEYFDVQDEIVDKYGEPPKAVQKLLELVHIKANAHKAGIKEITEKAAFILIKINEENSLNFDVLMDMVLKEPLKYGLNPKNSFEFLIKTDRLPKKSKYYDSIDIVREFLKKAAVFE